ncbi:MAG TPA: hypothetical protein VMC43_01335 [Candidatus Paceibacterota bacterium]|nr:hypothetical protein [Candidatus Paceibacterota bacterium]
MGHLRTFVGLAVFAVFLGIAAFRTSLTAAFVLLVVGFLLAVVVIAGDTIPTKNELSEMLDRRTPSLVKALLGGTSLALIATGMASGLRYIAWAGALLGIGIIATLASTKPPGTTQRLIGRWL